MGWWTKMGYKMLGPQGGGIGQMPMMAVSLAQIKQAAIEKVLSVTQGAQPIAPKLPSVVIAGKSTAFLPLVPPGLKAPAFWKAGKWHSLAPAVLEPAPEQEEEEELALEGEEEEEEE